MSTKLVDKGWNKIKREMKVYRKTEMVVGVLDGGVASYAVYNEFGTSRMPSRSFLRSTFEESGSQIYKAIKVGYTNVMNGGSAINGINRVGLMSQGLVQKKIRSGVGPALSPKTVAKKGHSQTLRDSGALLGSISYEIR